jgi:chromosome segregation ATPase
MKWLTWLNIFGRINHIEKILDLKNEEVRNYEDKLAHANRIIDELRSTYEGLHQELHAANREYKTMCGMYDTLLKIHKEYKESHP